MNINIKDIPKNERPRERLSNFGAENLSLEDLICIIIKTGTKDISVKILANKVLMEINNCNNINELNIQTLTKIKGIGFTKACELMAAIELGKRLGRKSKYLNGTKISNASDVFEYYKEKLSEKKQEYFYVIYLDNKNKVITDKVLFIGTINHSVVHPREIFKEAYLLSASSVICVHNHPSGNSLPSNEDILLTDTLLNVSKILGINLLDHIIIGSKNYYSFKEEQSK